MKWVTLRFTTICHHCGDEFVEEFDVNAVDVEYAPEAPPRRCEECEGQLRGNPHAWHRTVAVVDVEP